MIKHKQESVIMICLFSTNSVFLEKLEKNVRDEMARVVRLKNKGRSVSTQISYHFVVLTAEQSRGNRNLTLRRSPHGNKKHRESFVPSRYRSIIQVTFDDNTTMHDLMWLQASVRKLALPGRSNIKVRHGIKL